MLVELLMGLLGWSCALATIAVIGHGIWLLGALMLRSMFDSPLRERERLRKQLQQMLLRGSINREQYQQMSATLRGVHGAATTGAETTSAVGRLPAQVPVALEAESSAIVATPVLAEAVPIAAPPRADVAGSAHRASPTVTREAHPLERESEPELPPAQVRRRRTLADVLQVFMQESNIRWVELIGGLLIVGGAVCLVVSLQATLSDAVPYFPALIFMLITAAIHGAGLYTLRRWKLQTTSRGVLIIALLLVPLNFLAAIALSGGDQGPSYAATDPRFMAAVAIGLLVFGTLCTLSSRSLMPELWWCLTVSIIGTSCGQIIVHRLGDDAQNAWHSGLLLALPLVSYGVGLAGTGAYLQRRRRLSLGRARHALTLVGITTFALIAPVGLFVARSDVPRRALAELGPSLGLAVSALLGLALLLQERALARRMAAVRVTATTLALCAAAMLVALVVFAWPDPRLLIATGALNGALLLALAIAGNLPLLHAAAISCFAITYWIGIRYVWSDVEGQPSGRQLLADLLTSYSSIALTALAAAIAGVGSGLHRMRRDAAAHTYYASGGALSLLSIALAAYCGFNRDPSLVEQLGASAVLALYCVLGLVVAPRIARPLVSWSVSLLLLVTLLQITGWNPWVAQRLSGMPWPWERPLLLATLAHAFLLTAAGCVAIGRARSLEPGTLRDPWFWSGLATSAIAAVAVLVVLDGRYAAHALYAAVLGATWWGLAMLGGAQLLWFAGQVAVTLAVAFAALAIGRRTGHWDGTLYHVNFTPWLIVALSCCCIAWIAVRSGARRWLRTSQELLAECFGFDRILLAALIVATVGLMGYLCTPGILMELGIWDVSDVSLERGAELSLASPYGLALAALFLALAAGYFESRSPDLQVAILIAAAAVPLLIATQFHSDIAVASATRWGFAVYTAVATALLLVRQQIRGRSARRTTTPAPDGQDHEMQLLIQTMLAVGILPVMGLTLAAVVQATTGTTLGGPAATSWFGEIGPTANFACPLLLLVVLLVIYACHERHVLYMATASLFFQATVNLAFVLHVATSDANAILRSSIEWLQWNGLALGAFALLWLGLRSRIHGPGSADERRRAMSALETQVALALLVAGGIVLCAVASVGLSPEQDPGGDRQLAHYFSIGAAGLALLAWIWSTWQRRAEVASHSLGFVVLACGALAAIVCKTQSWGGHWPAFHVLTASFLAGMSGAGALYLWDSRRNLPMAQRAALGWMMLLGASVVVLGCRVGSIDAWPWWPGTSVLVVVALTAALGVLRRSSFAAYTATLLAPLSITLYWFAYIASGADSQDVLELFQLNLLALVVMCLLWLGVELFLQMAHDESSLQRVHHRMPPLALLLLAWMSFGPFLISFFIRFSSSRSVEVDASNVAGAATAALMAVLLLAGCWDRSLTRLHALLLYGMGLIGCLLLLDQTDDLLAITRYLPDNGEARLSILMLGGLIVGLFVAAIGAVWRRRGRLGLIACGLLRVPAPSYKTLWRSADHWLPAAQLTIAFLIVLVEGLVVAEAASRWLRVSAAFTPLALAYGLAMLAEQDRRHAWRSVSLVFITLSVIFLGWSDMEPDWSEASVLTRAVRLLIALAALSFAEGVVMVRLLNPAHAWAAVVRRGAVASAAAALAALLLVLTLELAFFEPEVGAPLNAVQTAAVAVILVGLIAAMISLAVLPGTDPLALSERGRMLYVYGAQVVGALLFAHIYLSEPDWFTGRIRTYWPYIIMLIAFAGVGAGEMLRRAKIRVLAEPLERTALFLPLLPALAFWVFFSEHALSYERNDISYAMVLFTIGLLYLVATILRPSLVSLVGAVVAGNASLWAFLVEEDLDLIAHPQLWLVPPAICVLIAVQLNRDRLSSQQLTAARYASAIVIYLSSTSEMFMAGIAESIWRPVALASLAVAGVFLGIVIRVRAFLYLGSSFLLLAVVGMVWHASSNMNHAWPWFAFTMALGVTILVLFGFFEKKRAEILRLIDELRQWDR